MTVTNYRQSTNGTSPFYKYKIDNQNTINKIISEYKKLLGLVNGTETRTFPGPQPVAVEKKDFQMLSKNKYMVCEKTDGERIVLLILNIKSDDSDTLKPMCFITNRNNEFYFIPLSCKRELFEGSIFDGEIIKNKNGVWTYMIHDCMCYNGVDFTKKIHKLRYGAVVDFIVKRYFFKESDPFQIKTKLFYSYGPELNKTWEHIKSTTENNIDGLIFTPVNEPMRFGRMKELLKWKEPGDNTMDFLVKKINSKKLGLYYINKKNVKICYKIFQHTDLNFKLINDFIPSDSKQAIVEFKYSLETKIFTPYRIRTDKNEPNGEITINNTMKNIEESIDIDNFLFF